MPILCKTGCGNKATLKVSNFVSWESSKFIYFFHYSGRKPPTHFVKNVSTMPSSWKSTTPSPERSFSSVVTEWLLLLAVERILRC